ncbi:hypothetical protein [Acidisoma sp. C75]
MPNPLASRRALLGLLGTGLATLGGSAGALGLVSRAAEAAATDPVFAQGVTVLSSGPAYGYIAGWAKLLLPQLLQGLPPNIGSSFEAMGGPDGVTVCNAFGARMDPDGSTLMVAPGAAMLAWLEGDSRVKYDPARWVPALIGTGPVVLVGTTPLSQHMTQRRALRLGASNPIGPELAAIAALDLLGIPVAPIYGETDPKSLSEALGRGHVDVALLSGPKIREALAEAAAKGAQPLCLLAPSSAACTGPATRDDLLPDVPTFLELVAALDAGLPNDIRLRAFEAAAVAASICFAAVLPDLVRPATVSAWRRGAEMVADNLSLAAVATQQEIRFQTGRCAEVLMRRATGSPSAAASLRATLLHRFGWRAS